MNIQTERAYVGFYAYDDDSYDGVPDGNTTIGHGMTEQEAIEDLMQQLGTETSKKSQRSDIFTH